MVKSWKIIVATLVIYTAGLVTGTFLNDLRSTESTIARKDPMPRGPRMHDFIQRFGSKLNLSDTQKTNITQILKTSQERMDALMKEMHPKIAEEFTQVNAEIKGHLTETQAALFEDIMKTRRNQGPGGRGRGFGNGPGRGGENRRPDGGRGGNSDGEGFRPRHGPGLGPDRDKDREGNLRDPSQMQDRTPPPNKQSNPQGDKPDSI
jgi:hypothetical protein